LLLAGLSSPLKNEAVPVALVGWLGKLRRLPIAAQDAVLPYRSVLRVIHLMEPKILFPSFFNLRPAGSRRNNSHKTT
jgi:hypothetical protein